MPLSDEIQKMVKDSAGFLTTTDFTDAVIYALEKISKYSPMTKVYEISGNDSAYEWDLPADFEDKFSRIVSVEYPVTEQQPEFLAEEEYMVYLAYDQTTGTVKPRFRLVYITPATNEKVRVYYTAKYSEGELPPSLLTPTKYFGASYCFTLLAAKFAQSKEPTIGADVVDYKEKVNSYLKLAEEAEKKALQSIPKKTYTQYKDWDTELQFGSFLWHPRRRR